MANHSSRPSGASLPSCCRRTWRCRSESTMVSHRPAVAPSASAFLRQLPAGRSATPSGRQMSQHSSCLAGGCSSASSVLLLLPLPLDPYLCRARQWSAAPSPARPRWCGACPASACHRDRQPSTTGFRPSVLGDGRALLLLRYAPYQCREVLAQEGPGPGIVQAHVARRTARRHLCRPNTDT